LKPETNAAEPEQPALKFVGPLWYTVVLIIVLDGLGILASLGEYTLRELGQSPPVSPDPVSIYIILIVSEWLTVGWVWLGVRRQGLTVPDILGGRLQKSKEIGINVLLGLGFWFFWLGVWNIEYRLFGSTGASLPVPLPHGPTQVLLSIGLGLSAGICEEIVFRGYLQQQFQAMSGGATSAVMLQAIVFGVAHGDASVKVLGMHVLFGLLAGCIVRWRGSLWPAVTLHIWTDLAVFLLRF